MRRTSIQVKEDLLAQLEAVKQEANVESYDEAIRLLLAEHHRLPKSLFGTFSELPEFTRDEIDRLD